MNLESLLGMLNSKDENDRFLGIQLAKNSLNKIELEQLRKSLNPVSITDIVEGWSWTTRQQKRVYYWKEADIDQYINFNDEKYNI